MGDVSYTTKPDALLCSGNARWVRCRYRYSSNGNSYGSSASENGDEVTETVVMRGV